jgi:hypothetical protein
MWLVNQDNPARLATCRIPFFDIARSVASVLNDPFAAPCGIRRVQSLEQFRCRVDHRPPLSVLDLPEVEQPAIKVNHFPTQMLNSLLSRAGCESYLKK